MPTTSDPRLFPRSYHQARDIFLELTGSIQGPVEASAWEIPSKSDSDLFVDSVYLPSTREAQRLFVIISGIHGLEGYAGSAIQNLLIREILPRVDRSQTGFLIVHSMNPYGYKHHARCTEGHVNLNRNCSADPAHFQQKNPRSLELSRQFVPKEAVASEKNKMMGTILEREGHLFFGDIGMDELIKAVGIGQFEDPEGLEFGGVEPEIQTQLLIDRLRGIIKDYKDVISLDMHTGLGHRGHLHLLTGEVEGALNQALFGELFRPTQDGDIYHFTPWDAEGFYKTSGSTNNLLPELATSAQRVCALTWEFGTIGHDRASQVDSLNRWLVAHQGLFYGYQDEGIESRVKALYLDKFRPDDEKWARLVLHNAGECFERILTRCGSLS